MLDDQVGYAIGAGGSNSAEASDGGAAKGTAVGTAFILLFVFGGIAALLVIAGVVVGFVLRKKMPHHFTTHSDSGNGAEMAKVITTGVVTGAGGSSARPALPTRPSRVAEAGSGSAHSQAFVPSGAAHVQMNPLDSAPAAQDDFAAPAFELPAFEPPAFEPPALAAPEDDDFAPPMYSL